jgi:hypothetical protein
MPRCRDVDKAAGGSVLSGRRYGAIRTMMILGGNAVQRLEMQSSTAEQKNAVALSAIAQREV